VTGAGSGIGRQTAERFAEEGANVVADVDEDGGRATVDEQIRVSDRVKRILDRRRREGESYNDVLERVLEDEEGDFYDGFGRWSEAQAERVREQREQAKQKRRARMQRRAGDDGEDGAV
jgi:NAD(P)-dependent dehydrogenase (short-subunit alcohol dehydrogenase family)